jgi:hypothetical protein
LVWIVRVGAYNDLLADKVEHLTGLSKVENVVVNAPPKLIGVMIAPAETTDLGINILSVSPLL